MKSTTEAIPALIHSQDTVANPRAHAAALLGRLQAIDPEHRLADPGFRVSLLVGATPTEVSAAPQDVNTTLYGSETRLFQDPITLGKGDGEDRKVGYVGLRPEDGREVFDYAVGVCQTVLAQDGPDGLGKVGTIMGGAIVGTQMFADGNKRTARAAYLLAARGFDGSDGHVAEYGRVLGFTEEARQSIFFNPHDPTARRSFSLEGLSPEDARAAYRFDSAWQAHQPPRRELDALLDTRIHDAALRKSCIDVLQQDSFGVEALTSLLGVWPEFEGEPGKVEDAAPAIAKAEEAIRQLTPEVAQQLIANDAERKKEFMLRMIDSVTGQRPLSYIDYRGESHPEIVLDVFGS